MYYYIFAVSLCCLCAK